MVNVLDVPVLAIPMNGISQRELDFLESAVFTMDPEDKYIKPRPVRRREDMPPLTCPATPKASSGKNRFKLFGAAGRHTPLPTPKVHEASVQANSWKFWKRRPEASPSPARGSLLAKFQRNRGIPSKALAGSQDCSRQVKTSREASTALCKPFYVRNNKAASTNDLSCMDGLAVRRPGFKCGPDPVTPAHLSSTASSLDVVASSPRKEPRHHRQGSYNASVTLEDLRQDILAEASASCDFGPLEAPRMRNSFANEGCPGPEPTTLKGAMASSSSLLGATQTFSAPSNNLNDIGGTVSLEDEEIEDGPLFHDRGLRRKQSFTSSVSLSYRTSDNFSPGLASTNNMSDVMSHHRLSQPETPSASEYGGDFIDSSTTRLASQTQMIQICDDEAGIPALAEMGSSSTVALQDETFRGFGGYNLPEPDQGSTQTLKRIPNKSFSSSKHDQVHSWNDGSEHRMTALDTLITDLGYLGKVIN